MELFLSEWADVLRSKNNVKLHKNVFFIKEAACACINISEYITSQVSIAMQLYRSYSTFLKKLMKNSTACKNDMVYWTVAILLSVR